MIDEIKRIIKASEIMKYVVPVGLKYNDVDSKQGR